MQARREEAPACRPRLAARQLTSWHTAGLGRVAARSCLPSPVLHAPACMTVCKNAGAWSGPRARAACGPPPARSLLPLTHTLRPHTHAPPVCPRTRASPSDQALSVLGSIAGHPLHFRSVLTSLLDRSARARARACHSSSSHAHAAHAPGACRWRRAGSACRPVRRTHARARACLPACLPVACTLHAAPACLLYWPPKNRRPAPPASKPHLRPANQQPTPRPRPRPAPPRPAAPEGSAATRAWSCCSAAARSSCAACARRWAPGACSVSLRWCWTGRGTSPLRPPWCRCAAARRLWKGPGGGAGGVAGQGGLPAQHTVLDAPPPHTQTHIGHHTLVTTRW